MPRLLLLAVIALAFPAAETAAFPGTNGRIVFTQDPQPLDANIRLTHYVCAARPDGARPMKIAESTPFGLGSPAVSSDGSLLAFVERDGVFVAKLDGTLTSVRRVANGSTPAWSPDTRALFYANHGDIFSVLTDGTERSAFTSGPWYDQMPAVAPAGRTVAYVRGPQFGTTSDELVLRDVEGAGERVILSMAGIASPDWSPDGGRIVFAVNSTIATVAASGGDYRTITSGADDREPAYSPDGTRIAFERAGDIWTMATDGSDLVNITRSPVLERQPAWQTGNASSPAGSDRPCAIIGTEGADELFGSEHNDVFYDLGGDDTIRGFAGGDLVYDGGGNDLIEGGDGDDRIFLRLGLNAAFGGSGDDTISGGGDLHWPAPAAVPQRIYGDDGADLIFGSTAADRIAGGPGNDVVYGLAGPDLIFGGPANDLLVGAEGNDRLSGGPNADYLLGQAGVDVFLGGGGDDLLFARDARREHVDGGAGFDRARLDPSDRRIGVERAIR